MPTTDALTPLRTALYEAVDAVLEGQGKRLEMWQRCSELEMERDALRKALAEAERHRDVLAHVLRDFVREVDHHGPVGQHHQVAYDAFVALRDCGLLRPCDDPAKVPSVWLNPNEE